MPMPRLRRRWTVADLQHLPDDGRRYEVIDGELYVTPAPAWKHQAAAGDLHRLIVDYLARHRVGYAFMAPADVTFSDRRGVQPDLFVVPLVSGRRPERFEEVRHLLLAVEVLSPSTARADRVAKRTVYREEGVDEYWVVDLDARAVERSTPAEARVEVIADRLTWAPYATAEPLAVDVAEYFRRVLDE